MVVVGFGYQWHQVTRLTCFFHVENLCWALTVFVPILLAVVEVRKRERKACEIVIRSSR